MPDSKTHHLLCSLHQTLAAQDMHRFPSWDISRHPEDQPFVDAWKAGYVQGRDDLRTLLTLQLLAFLLDEQDTQE